MKYQEKYFEEAVKIKDIDGIAPVAMGLCFAYMRAGECFKIYHVASKVLPLLERAKKELDFFGLMGNTYAVLCGYYGYSQGMLGNFREGINLFEKALSFSQRIDDLVGLAIVEVHYGLMLLAKGEGQNAIGHFQNSFKYCEETKLEILRGVLWNCLGGGYYLLGEMEAAQTHLERSLKIYMDSDRQDNLAMIYNYLSLINIDFKQLSDAQAYVEKALELAIANGEKSNEACSRIIFGILIGKKDPILYPKAKDSILLGLETLKKLKLKPAYAKHNLDLGEFYADSGQKKKALNILKRAESMFKEMGMDYYLEKTQLVLNKL
jgi:tetratricopeptide (TPR) repeat protein